MMINLASIFGQLQGALMNPMQFLMSRGIPQSALQNPQQAVQNLLNNGQMTQAQFNEYQQMARQIQTMPQFNQMFR